MAFLEVPELKTVSTIKVVNLITNNDDATVLELVAENIDLMKSYIYKYYDAEAIFNAEGDERSKVILKHLKSLLVYDLYMIRNKAVTEEIDKKYNEAMGWLEKINKGSIDADLPRKKNDTDGDGTPDTASTFMKLGSRKSYKNHW